MSARRELRNAVHEWRAAPNHVRRTTRVVSENRVIAYFGVAAVLVFLASCAGLLR